MPHNGFTLIEVLISLSLLGIVTICSFAAQTEYQLLNIQAQHFQEQQEQLMQLRESIESDLANTNSGARTTAINRWRKALPKYMKATLRSSGNNQLNLKLCSAQPTTCLSAKIVV